MNNLTEGFVQFALAWGLCCGGVGACASAGDLSKFRDFQFGSELSVIAKQVGVPALEAKTVHRRPALIQELTWRPQPIYWADRQESAKLFVFSFYNGTLYCIAVEYDRDQTEGLTSEDLVDVFSTVFGVRPSPLPSELTAPAAYSDRQEVLARWRDPLHHFDLIRSPYGAWYRLIGVLEAADAAASIASQQSERLDLGEAPQREAARIAAELNSSNAKSERARVVNKPKFRP